MTDRDVSEDIGQLALCAFRYSLGRSAGVPAEICERIMRIEDQLPQSWKNQIAKVAGEALLGCGVVDMGDEMALLDIAELWGMEATP